MQERLMPLSMLSTMPHYPPCPAQQSTTQLSLIESIIPPTIMRLSCRFATFTHPLQTACPTLHHSSPRPVLTATNGRYQPCRLQPRAAGAAALLLQCEHPRTTAASSVLMQTLTAHREASRGAHAAEHATPSSPAQLSLTVSMSHTPNHATVVVGLSYLHTCHNLLHLQLLQPEAATPAVQSSSARPLLTPT
jgi:hypothetical protein